VYEDAAKNLKSLTVGGKPVSDTEEYSLCMQGYHSSNAGRYIGVEEKDLRASGKAKVVTTSAKEVLEESFRNNNNASSRIEGRLVYA